MRTQLFEDPLLAKVVFGSALFAMGLAAAPALSRVGVAVPRVGKALESEGDHAPGGQCPRVWKPSRTRGGASPGRPGGFSGRAGGGFGRPRRARRSPMSGTAIS